MRSKNAFKNLVFYLIYEVLVFVLGIIFPRLIILTYGSEINGLTSTITRILSLINLIQAGAVGAAIYQMYKPVAEGDYETQSKIIYSSRRFYNKVSIIYLLVSLLAGVFYGFYLENDHLTFFSIFLSFLILALNGANILLFNSICDIFISPHQKKYLLIISAICEQFLRYGLLCIVLFLKLNFVFIYLCYFVGGAASVLLNFFFYKRLTRGKIDNNPSEKGYVIPDRKYLMLSSIGSEAVTASPTIIITTFIGLVYSSVFSVYALVFTSMKTLLNSIQLSFSAIFGNLTKTASDEKIYQVHSAIELLTIFLGTIAASCVGFLIVPFITLYTVNADVNYLSYPLAFFVVAYTVMFAFGTSFGYVATVYGLFKDTCKIVLVFGALGILLSIACAILFGMPYVMVGLLFNQFGCSIATLIVIKKKIKWFRIRRLLVRTMLMMLITCLSTVLFFLIQPNISGWIEWALFGIIVAILSGIILLSYCFVFERKSLKLLKNYLVMFKRRRTNNSASIL